MTITFPYWLIWTVPVLVFVMGWLFTMRDRPGPMNCVDFGPAMGEFIERVGVIILTLLVVIAVLLLDKCGGKP